MRLGKDVLEADLYAELGVLPDATSSELRVAYRRRARASHPDLHQLDPQALPRMSRLNVAARVLLDPALRKSYDRNRRAPAPGVAQARRAPAWFDRHEHSADDDWVRPPRPARHAAGSYAGTFAAQLRGRDSRFGLQIDELIRSLSARQQIAMTALLLAAAVGLIALAQPYTFGGGLPNATQPRTVSASMLFP